MSRWLLLGLTLGALTASTASGHPPQRHELVAPATCLAGNWGTPRDEWRVQFGFFSDERLAARRQAALQRSGIRSDQYIAIWGATGDEEPRVLVSRAVFRDLRAATRYARQLRKRGVAAFPRRYVRYVR
ncbi:MAG: SPOR domain-containing protein [Polyangiaceae bacterium]